jgi:hypothetical protein
MRASGARRGWPSPGPGICRSAAVRIDRKGSTVLLALAIILLIISIAGGVIIHPVLFVLAIVAIAMFFSGRRRIA